MNPEIAEITTIMKERVEGKDVGGSLKFDFEGEGVIHIDGTDVCNDDKDADCTVSVAMDTFKQLMDGSQDPTMAFMQGKLRVDGDMGLAMKLGPILAG